MNEEKAYLVTHVRRIEVTQEVTATSKAEAMRKLRYGEERHSEWLNWHTISEPTTYRAHEQTDGTVEST